MARPTRQISWIRAARKGFEAFPTEARDRLLDALTFVAEGGHPTIAKPLTGLGSGILELALRYQNEAYRVVYAVQIGEEIWILHAFQKKSKSGIATPKAELDLIRERLRRIKDGLQ